MDVYKFDSWSLGLTLYECIDGKYAETLKDIDQKIKDSNKGVNWVALKKGSQQAYNFITKLLHPRPSKRPKI